MASACVKGHNWGMLDATTDEIVLRSDGGVVLALNPAAVFNTSIANKTEVSVEFDEQTDVGTPRLTRRATC